MLFVIHCVDKPDHQDVRAAHRRHHLEHLSKIRDKVQCAGPTLSEDGESMTGSLLIIDFPDRAAAEGFLRSDPYARAGLFESVTVMPWKKVMPSN